MLAPHRYYYLHNFERALQWLGQRYGDVLDAQEQQFLADFAQAPMQSQALMVRMLMRRGPWFRADKLVYDEIPDVHAAAQPLLALGWIDADADMALAELFALHTKPELLQIFANAGLARSLRKADMLAQLAQWVQQSDPGAEQEAEEQLQPYHRWHPQAEHAAWRVTVGELAEGLRLMFFGNLHQDWSEFVLADLGIFKYETVAFDAQSRAFQTRADVQGYRQLQQWRQAVDEDEDRQALMDALAAWRSANPWLQQRHAKVLLRLGQACERSQSWALAEQAYAASPYPGARHRRMRVLERMERFDEALALASAAAQQPESDEESQRLARMLPRLRRHLGQRSASRRALKPEVAQLREDVALDRVLRMPRMAPDLAAMDALSDAAALEAALRAGEAMNTAEAPEGLRLMPVEYALRDHWHRDDAPVFYVENALVNSLFGLLCWPAIFAPLPGAFFHPFQAGPADVYAPDFVARRAALFGACLAMLDDGSYAEVIRQRFADKAGLQSPFVFWGTLTDALLEHALACIPAAHLKLLFQRLLGNLQANRTGFPDLVRFWPLERRYQLVEVKGPGDKLQDNQIRWLEYCAAHGIPVGVCHVQWREAGA
ncbi:VRR-NUC domain-containing protein [Comamonas koreensis]|uniref:phosphodiesterase I n=1 Tax=Comamonas koreensis TaxID=160825 RepID=A0AAW4Y2W5_9BURK|nr:VRR-NUC domain-containing protein [Comamonas koreensis]MCD2167464.1 VRR-NUC domain-containing protein [Comamonas koreensis]